MKQIRIIGRGGAQLLLALLMTILLAGSAVAATELKFNELYSSASALGLTMSDKLLSLDGQDVVIRGFMAPPLKPTIRFFVLTSRPMSICPFCSTDADWPVDIIVVKLSKPVVALPFDRPIEVTGRLELGTEVDEETGFVSLVRVDASAVKEVAP